MLVCLKIASRGDLLMAAPAFRLLRERSGGEKLVLVVGASCVDVARHLPYFDEIRVIDDAALFAPGRARRLRAAWSIIRSLRGADQVVIFHRDWRYALLSWIAGVPRRVGFESAQARRFLTHPVGVAEAEHHAWQYLHLAGVEDPAQRSKATLAASWCFAPGEIEAGLSKAATSGFEALGAEWVALGFGGGRNVKTSTHLKCWPIESYRELALQLTREGRGVVWLGDSNDADLLGEDYAGVNLAGKLTISETAAVLSRCQQVVANDTFLMHLGEALGVPTLGVFGPTNAPNYRPLGARSNYLWIGPATLACSPCTSDGSDFPPCRFEHRCMSGIGVERVLATIGGGGGALAGARPAARCGGGES